ncbi:pantoate--beta-alanine ligase [Acidiphilium sp. AL]|uniref:Pantothenate synthetase n=1 Tax=Acidiphilium iwatense TaxID=768198 RepID=A0ABS9DWL7_9PROT|nr:MULTISPECIES: pantoate--beta-alanine ligase [Acidiphilium]MCF3946580.1 pantoate--beta-alanine ligase [Acidiphilium iwatense]MCU4160239.1 pantoate--beta-alanine ligase [Acidiphilium sp. AL]
MHIARTLAELRAARAGHAGPLALVPTMGALHDGHLALVRAARAAGGAVAASIFVNPTQFGPNEDFGRYPRDPDADCAMLEAAGCDLVWLPTVDIMYPPDGATMIDVAGPALLWEGAARPGHFRGVATVVAKLFGQMRPDSAYFGEKDWQQIQVIHRMAEDLLLPVAIVAVPTRREADGLAMSSRNRYLTPEDRARAPDLFATLCRARDELRAGAAIEATLAAGRETLARAGFAVDYLALVAPESLAPLNARAGAARLIAAARLGSTRLLDNIAV